MDFPQIVFVGFCVLSAIGLIRIFMEELDGVLMGVVGVLGILVTSFFMGGVSPREEKEAKAERDKIPVLFSKTEDGCSVYKFVASGRDRFFTRCTKSDTIDTVHSESCGKNCTHDVSIQVEVAK